MRQSKTKKANLTKTKPKSYINPYLLNRKKGMEPRKGPDLLLA